MSSAYVGRPQGLTRVPEPGSQALRPSMASSVSLLLSAQRQRITSGASRHGERRLVHAVLAGPSSAKLRAAFRVLHRCLAGRPIKRDDLLGRLARQSSRLTVADLPNHFDGANPRCLHGL